MLTANWKPCPFCGKEYPPSAVSCARCKRYFATGRLGKNEIPVAVIPCTACGSPNYAYRERCWKCLTPIEAPASPVTAETTISSVPPSTPDRNVPEARTHVVDRTAEIRARAEDEVASLTRDVESGKADSDTYELRAGYLIELGRLDEAEQDVEKVNSPLLQGILRGDIAFARGLLNDAADSYELALAQDPEKQSVSRKLGQVYVKLGSFRPEEIEFVRSTLRSQIDRLSASRDWIPWVTFLHERYSTAREWDHELDLLQTAAEKSPLITNPRLGLWMIDALIETGELDEAAATLSALSLSNQSSAAITAFEHVAAAMIKNGRQAEALTHYRALQAAGNVRAAHFVEMLERAAAGERFVLLKKVGSGAAAEVWRAFDLYTGEDVGVKILHESAAEDASVRSELEHEFQVMSDSLSPRLTRVIPGTLQPDRFAMELLEYSLLDLLQSSGNEAGVPLNKAIQVAKQVAEGIEYIHARGFVYQDLSPQNILFDGDSVKLCDLGGLRDMQHASEVTTVAKVAYASPEQCALLMGSSAVTIDRRSDIYSLGIILYQMATGRLPFEGPDQAVIHAHLYSTPVAPIIHRQGIGRDFSEVILRCMARLPEERFQTAADLWGSLDQVRLDSE